MVTVGETYYYKTTTGRGRPFVGKVVRKMGMFTEMDNKGKVVRVKTALIGKPYTFKPYVTAKRVAARTAQEIVHDTLAADFGLAPREVAQEQELQAA